MEEIFHASTLKTQNGHRAPIISVCAGSGGTALQVCPMTSNATELFNNRGGGRKAYQIFLPEQA